MRRNGGLWMVTLADREPDLLEELPMYFKTRKAATYYRDEQSRADDGWELVVRPAPDDVRVTDIMWYDE
jgi:hypothetical protein